MSKLAALSAMLSAKPDVGFNSTKTEEGSPKPNPLAKLFATRNSENGA